MFRNNKVYRLAQKPFLSEFEELIVCPKCGNETWIYQNRTGTKKLPDMYMKIKCEQCGYWKLVVRKDIIEVLGR